MSIHTQGYWRLKCKQSVNQASVNKQDLSNIYISYPEPIAEQRRIVALLDEAFAGLETLRANAEKNVQNARDLFGSYLSLVFSKPSEEWRSCNFESCLEDFKYTKKIQRKDFLSTGIIPIISQEAEFINGYWNNEKDACKIVVPVVLFGDHTKVLKYIDFDFVLGADGVKILLPREFLNPKYFYFYLKNVKIPSLGYARHYRLLRQVKIFFPNLPEQESIAINIDRLFNEQERLTGIYIQKLAAIDELKQSILHRAFSGQLTTSETAAA